MTITTTISPAGFIIHDGDLIWATGGSRDGAYADLDNVVRHLSPDDAPRVQALRCQPATAALILSVLHRGGAISWDAVDGVACTPDERDDAMEA
jgi:hypothetical protein